MKHLRFLPALLLLVAAAPASAQLSRQWQAQYDGPQGQGDYAQDVVADAAGNAYVTGFRAAPVAPSGTLATHFLTLKYDPSGNLLWQRTFHTGWATLGSVAYQVELAPNGDVLVAGGTNSGNDWTVLRYDSAGNLLWESTHFIHQIGFGYLSGIFDLQVDASGNAYLVGELDCCGSDAEWRMLKLDPGGGLVWSYDDNHGGQGANVHAIELDPLGGGIYVVGTVTVAQQDSQASLKKLSPAGQLLWERTYGTTGTVTFDVGVDLAVDDAGLITVLAGQWNPLPSPHRDALVVRVDGAGNELWQTSWDSPIQRNELPFAVAVDASGAAIATGQTDTANVDDRDAFLLAIEADGSLRFATTYGRTGDFLHDDPRHVAVDDAGRIVIAGQARPDPNTYHLLVAQFGADGSLQYEDLNGGPTGLGGHNFALTNLPDGRTWAAGTSPQGGSQADIVTAHYAPEGATSFCVAAPNGAGTQALMGWQGSLSIAANDFHLTASGAIPSGFGFFYYGGGQDQVPLGNGFRCVASGGAGIYRLTPATLADGLGSSLRHVDLTTAPAGSGPGTLTAGSTWHFQYWYRDTVGFNFSDGLSVTFNP